MELWQQGGTAPANQPPVLAAIGNRSAVVGQPLTFTASATDPDAGQSLTYTLTGTVPAGASINASTGAFSWTPAATGSFPVTVRVSDNGAPVLTDEETFTVTVTSTPPTGSYVFYRAVNLNGSAITLDGNAWAGSTAPNYSYVGTPLSTPSVTLIPATDATRAAMIRSFVYNYPGSVSVTLTAVPAGNYQVYAYVFEDNNAEVYSLLLNGQTVVSNRNSGPAGTWARLGPWPVAVGGGQVQLASTGGTANISGIELWQQSAANRGTQPAAGTTARETGLSAEAGLQLYPNPSADGRFSLVLPPAFAEDVRYTLVSALGTQLAAGKLPRRPAGTVVALDLAPQLRTAGVYYLRLECAGRPLHIKLLRE
ncbi:Ig domain-containing protein [Hymenobacter sp. 15J16-1T3B]|nr:Ig domain-containing protein [Hymenobacter sp. 15J16-1T3B]